MTLLLTLVSALAVAQEPATQGREAAEAERLWEQMIQAKGGRERLHSVETMIQETHQKLRFHNPKWPDGENHFVLAFAFPDCVWDFVDSGRTVFASSASTANASTGISYVAYPNNDIRNFTDPRSGKDFLERAQLIYLNETRWFKPNAVRVLRTKDIPRDVDAIETAALGERVDFWIDRASHLPRRITRYYVSPRSSRPFRTYYQLSKFEEIDGIKIPGRVLETGDDGGAESIEFKTTLNPNLREDLFTAPPRFEDGPEAWKPR